MMKPSLQLKLGQTLTMTPQLQQAIRLLQMPALELQAHIREQLESNVMLEPVDEYEATGSFETLEPHPMPEEKRVDAQAAPEVAVEAEVIEDNWSERSAGSDSWRDDDERAAEVADDAQLSLQDHLVGQLEYANLAPRDLAIARAIVDAINDDGYLFDSLDDIAATLLPEVTADADDVDRVLRLVQTLDPAGVAARSLGECLALQLRTLHADTPGLRLALAIADKHLDKLADRELTLLRRELAASDDELAQAVALVRGLHPRPGATVSSAKAEYVVPDVFVRRTDRGWIVEVNSSTLPRVRLNQSYADMLGRGAGHSSMRAQLQEARWLLKSLEIRNETLMKVARSIVERQTAFLEHGEESMRPMILKDIAQAIDMHESTISRVTSSKYMHTPRGVFELKYFFSSQVEAADGGGASSTAVRAKIRKLIKEEDTGNPLSDSRIAELLSGEGIAVARRTVAKYREALGLAPSNERKAKAAQLNR
jgi:RNA polymerase sigma-54 factor